MRRIGTRLVAIAFILVVAVSFSACSLFTLDLDKKYSADTKVLTTANSDLSVSRSELYHAYAQWGYQYASSFEDSGKLLEFISEALLNDKIMEQRSIEQFGALDDIEEALALKQAYASMDKTIRAYIFEALGMEDNAENETEEASDEDKVDQPYTPNVLVTPEGDERVYTLNLTSYEDSDNNYALRIQDYSYYSPKNIPGVASPKNVRQAISKIIRNLQAIESGFTKLKTPARDYLQDGEKQSDYFKFLSSSERAVLNREIDRMVKANRTSILVNRLNVAYNLGFFTLGISDPDTLAQAYQQAWKDYLRRGENFDAWCEKINGINQAEHADCQYFGCGRDIATNMAKKAIENYKSLVKEAIKQYDLFPNSNLESSLISSGLADAYYIPQNVANNLFTVSHILVGFTEEQKTQYQKIQKRAEKDPSYNAENELNKLYAEVSSNGVSAANIYGEVKTALDHANTVEEKYQIFRQYINKYNTDPGMQNLDQLNSSTSKPQFEYLMSTTESNNTMVESFTKTSLKLKNNGVNGKGTIDKTWSEYGLHIIMYTRDVSDFIFTAASGVDQNYDKTLFATLTSYGKRTKFNTIVDNVCARDYSEYRELKLKEYKAGHQVSIIKSEFKDFLKK